MVDKNWKDNRYWVCNCCGKVYITFPWEKNRPEPKCEYLCEILSSGYGYKQHKWIEVQVQTSAEAEKFETKIKTQESETRGYNFNEGWAKVFANFDKQIQRNINTKWYSERAAEKQAANRYLYKRSSENSKIREQREQKEREEREREERKEQEKKRLEWYLSLVFNNNPYDKSCRIEQFLEEQRENAEIAEQRKKAEIAEQRAREIERQRVQRRQEFWRKIRIPLFLAIVLVFSVIIFRKFHFESANIDIANGISSEDKTVANITYDADVVKDFNHAVFECGDYRKISGDGFMVHVIDRKGMTVTYANKQVTLPYDARKPLSRNGMYVWSVDDSKGFYLKPTMAGYLVYTYKTPGEMVNDKMSLYSAYSCGSFINNTRYPFLHKEHVSKNFTDLFDTADLKLVRNSIFASHGFVFKSDDVTNYFRKYPWYHPGNNSLDDYTQIEKDNAKFIKKIEDRRNKK